MSLLEVTVANGALMSVDRVTLREAVSEPFQVDLWVYAADPSVDLEGIVGLGAKFHADSGYRLAGLDGGREWSGVVSYAEQVHAVVPKGGHKALSSYYLRIVPSLWLLTQKQNHRIFQQQKIPDIVETVLKEWGVEYEWQLDDDYRPLEYKVQYAESDFAFVSRLLEEAGIAYVHTSDVGKAGKLVMSDRLQRKPLREAPPITYEDNPTEAAEREYVRRVRLGHEVRPGAHMISDFDFRNPTYKLRGSAPIAKGREGSYEQFEYRPGAFLVSASKGGDTPVADDKGIARYEQAFGEARATRWLEGERRGNRTVVVETNVIDLGPATTYQIEGHPHEAIGDPLMVTEFTLEGSPNGDWTMIATAVFQSEPFRPFTRTPKPIVTGAQSATVVGPKGEEIHTDEFGRVRVQFPWDREGQSDDNSSCWIRVAQGWSGTGFGMINLPRIGQEVLVGFLAGDPDQPMLVGRVFNAVNPVPYKLPDHKTQSGWKTNSSPTNGGYNEIKFEDNADKEFIYIQAQRDLHQLVKRDQVERIERDHQLTILRHQDILVKEIKKETVEEDDHLHVVGDRFQKIDKSTSLTIGVDQDEKVGNKHALDAGKEIHLKAGMKVVIEAGSQLTVRGPGGFISIHPGGIDIQGTLVKINSGGSAFSGSGAKPTEPEDAVEATPHDESVD